VGDIGLRRLIDAGIVLMKSFDKEMLACRFVQRTMPDVVTRQGGVLRQPICLCGLAP
jgi:hypothetical protein